MASSWRMVLVALSIVCSPYVSGALASLVTPILTACNSRSLPASRVDSKEPADRIDGYRQWEKEISQGTKLYKLKIALEKQSQELPDRDLEDRSPLPMWFRILMRKQHQTLATSGSYQYPRSASRLLQRLIENPDGAEVDKLLESAGS